MDTLSNPNNTVILYRTNLSLLISEPVSLIVFYFSCGLFLGFFIAKIGSFLRRCTKKTHNQLRCPSEPIGAVHNKGVTIGLDDADISKISRGDHVSTYFTVTIYKNADPPHPEKDSSIV
ncbi:hypothetical protein DdX_18973 [Ditylenchus destructor]|uniref:Uncharacterized protein n=1 Tax=Ditylenchus destructor TaxID=166010 RepID=A0AAD4MIP0_9BILA|nr:hypothetical protein DdX_18973 [Ditylenchus destructor]